MGLHEFDLATMNNTSDAGHWGDEFDLATMNNIMNKLQALWI